MAEVDSLVISIGGESKTAVDNLNSLVSSLERIRTTSKGGAGLSSVSKQLQAIATASNTINSSGMGKIKELAASIGQLNGIKVSSSIATQLNKLSAALEIVKRTDGDKIKTLVDGLRPLSELGRSQLTSFINQLGKLPAVIAELDKADLGKFASQMKEAAAAMKPLADDMNKVAAGFSAFPARIQKFIQSSPKIPSANKKSAKSFGLLGTGISSATAKFGIYYASFRRLASVIGGWVKESNDYVENLNLFTVAMGEYAESAKAYAEEVQAAMGIDPSEWMRNQGTFMQMATGFGVVTDKAALMSKNLTQLGYDISSFYNISIEDAMTKLQSGMAGEIEPLRRLGYAIDVATLQQVAYRNGIEQNVNTMTQAQKAQLRYVAIMEQSSNAMGDLARTIQTPANAMRILQQQVTQLARAAGNLLIPASQQIIPVVQAVVEVLTDAVQALADLFGFQLTQIDYSGLEGVSTGGEEAEEALGGAASAAKDLKNAMLGIDELNVISPSTANAGAGAELGFGDLDLELPEYDFLKGLEAQTNKIKGILENILPLVLGIGTGLAAWKVATAIKKDLGILKNLLGGLLVTAGVTLLIDSIKEILVDGKLTWDRILQGAAGGLLAGAGLGLMLAQKWGLTWTQGMLMGAVIGVGVALMVMGITSMVKSGVNTEDAITTAIGAVLAGGGLGAFALTKAYGSTLAAGTGFVIGASFVLAFTLSGINFAGISNGQWDAGEWQSVIMSALSTVAAGVGGSVLATALGFATGGVGFAIGIGVGLLVNIVSISIAEGQNIRESVLKTFKEMNTGGVTLDDIGISLEGVGEEISAAFSGMVTSSASLENVKDNISNTIQSVSGFVHEVENGAVSIDENIGKIKTSFEQLKNDSAAIFEETRGIIIQGLGGAIGDVAEAAGVDIPAISALIGNIATTGAESAEAMLEEMSLLSEAFANGTVSAEEYYDSYYFIMDSYKSLVGDTTEIENFKKSIDDWKTSLDLSALVTDTGIDTAALASHFATLETNYTTTISNIDEGTEGFISAMDEIKRVAEETGIQLSQSDLHDMATLIIGAESERAANIETMNGYYGQVYDAIQTNLIGGLEDVVSNLQTDYANKSPIYRFFVSEADYVSKGISEYQTNVVDPTLAEIQSSMDRIGIEGEPWAQGAIDKIMSALFNTTILGDGTTITTFTNDTSTAFQDALVGVETNTVPVATETGAAIAEGMIHGSDTYMNENKGLFESIVDRLPQWAKNILGIHSPSTVFAEIGEYAMEGLGEGFENMPNITSAFSTEIKAMRLAASTFAANTFAMIQNGIDTFLVALADGEAAVKDATDSMSRMFRTMSNNSVSAINSIISSLNSIPRNITTVHTIITEKMPGSSSTKAFASGGFPEHGQLFLAREAGPELVGTIGGNTAVANNSQIVESVSRGVAEASQTQNALLREQNELLLAILQKTGTISISGKTIKAAYDKESSQRGASIMSGGVMAY